MKVRFLVVSVFVVGVSVMSPAVQAQLIVYDGFGYPDGEYFQISDGGDNAVDPSVDTGTYDNLDDGTGMPTVVGNPGRNGGVGPWLTSWTKRERDDNGADFIDGTSTLSYTDSNGNSLATTLGKIVYDGTGENVHAWRTFDASGIAGGSLTFTSTAGDYNVPRLGRQGSTIWMSFLGDRSAEGGGPLSGGSFVGMQFWDKQGLTASGDTAGGVEFRNRTGGIFRNDASGDWTLWDGTGANDPVGPSGITNGGAITGSGAADDNPANGDVFFVIKLDYSATTSGGLVTDGYADVSVWIDPDLDEVEPSGTPALTGSTYTAFNGINFFSNTPTGISGASSLDEIRLGVTYGDVSPIEVAGPDGDFDGDDDVDGADFLAWQRGEATGGATPANLTLWEDNYGSAALSAVSFSVPEPSSVLLLAIAGTLSVLRRRRQ